MEFARKLLVSAILLPVSGSLLWVALVGLRSGRVWYRVKRTGYRAYCLRQSQPVRFWLMVVGYLVMAVVWFTLWLAFVLA